MLLVQLLGGFGRRTAGLVVHHQRAASRLLARAGGGNAPQKVDLTLKVGRIARAAHTDKERRLGAHAFACAHARRYVAGEPPLKRSIQTITLLGGKPARTLQRPLARSIRALKGTTRLPSQGRQLRQAMKRRSQARSSIGVARTQGSAGGIVGRIFHGEVDEPSAILGDGGIAEHARPRTLIGLAPLGLVGPHHGKGDHARLAVGGATAEGSLADARSTIGRKAVGRNARRSLINTRPAISLQGLATRSTTRNAGRASQLLLHIRRRQVHAFHARRPMPAEVEHAHARLERAALARQRRLHIAPAALRQAGGVDLRRLAAHGHHKGLLRARKRNVEQAPRLGGLPALLVQLDGRTPIGRKLATRDHGGELFVVELAKRLVRPAFCNQRRGLLLQALEHMAAVERHIGAPFDRAALQRLRPRRIVSQLGHRHDGELKALAGMDGHDAHEIAAFGGQRARRLLGKLHAQRQLVGHARGPHAASRLDVARHADGLVHVPRTRQPLGTGRL